MEDNSRPKKATLTMTYMLADTLRNITGMDAVITEQYTEKPLKETRKKKDILPGSILKLFTVIAKDDTTRKLLEAYVGHEMEWEDPNKKMVAHVEMTPSVAGEISKLIVGRDTSIILDDGEPIVDADMNRLMSYTISTGSEETKKAFDNHFSNTLKWE